jgi:hypothetical protein
LRLATQLATNLFAGRSRRYQTAVRGDRDDFNFLVEEWTADEMRVAQAHAGTGATAAN